MDGHPSKDVLWKSNLLAEPDLDRNNESIGSIESLQDQYSLIGPKMKSSLSSPLLTLGSLASVCDGSYMKDAHSHFETATHTVSPLSTKRDELIAGLDPHNEAFGDQHMLASLTRTDNEARRAGLICTIEAIVKYLIKDLVGNAASIYVTIKARVRSQVDGITVSNESAPSIVTSRPSFPGPTIQKAWRFSKSTALIQHENI